MRWYENKQEGLGFRYFQKLDEKLERVVSNPYQYQIRYKSVRIAFLDIFPVGIHYTVENDKIFIHALLGTAENPQFWL